MNLNPARVWAYVGLTLGAVASLAANVRHTFLAPAGAAADWAPGADAVIAAIFWPVALFVGLEVLARSDFRAGWQGWALRLLGVGPVTLVAGFVSYRHLADLLSHIGETDTVATLGPFGVDGLMLICSAVLFSTARTVAPAVATVAAPAPYVAPRPKPRPRPYAWAVPAGARLLPIAPRVAPAPRLSGWVTAPGRTLAIVPAVAEVPTSDELVIPPAPTGGRPAEETRRLVADLKARGITKQEEVAARLGISRWALRTALAKTDGTPTQHRTRRPALAHA